VQVRNGALSRYLPGAISRSAKLFFQCDQPGIPMDSAKYRARPLIVMLSLVSLASCDRGGSEAQVAAEEECVPVPPGTVALIGNQLNLEGNGSIRNAWAVRSGANDSIYFVSAEMDGPFIEGSGHVGTWAVNDLATQGGPVWSISRSALEYSNWPSGATTSVGLSMDQPGAEKSAECVAESLEEG
jgi:hypothetical protein